MIEYESEGSKMADPMTREITMTVTFHPDSNSFESHTDPPPGTTPEFIWEALKLCVMQMVKASAWYGDPIVRENVEMAAKSMRLTVLGTEAAMMQAKARRQNLDKERGTSKPEQA